MEGIYVYVAEFWLQVYSDSITFYFLHLFSLWILSNEIVTEERWFEFIEDY